MRAAVLISALFATLYLYNGQWWPCVVILLGLLVIFVINKILDCWKGN